MHGKRIILYDENGHPVKDDNGNVMGDFVPVTNSIGKPKRRVGERSKRGNRALPKLSQKEKIARRNLYWYGLTQAGYTAQWIAQDSGYSYHHVYYGIARGKELAEAREKDRDVG